MFLPEHSSMGTDAIFYLSVCRLFLCVLENLDLSPFTYTWWASGCWQWGFKIRYKIFYTKPDTIKTIQQPKISFSIIFWKSVCGHMSSSLLSTIICITKVIHVILARNVWKMGSLDMLEHLEWKHIPKWFPWSLLFEHKNPTQWPTATNVEKLEKGINNLELLCLEHVLKFWSLMIWRKRILFILSLVHNEYLTMAKWVVKFFSRSCFLIYLSILVCGVYYHYILLHIFWHRSIKITAWPRLNRSVGWHSENLSPVGFLST